ncbi:MAG TPA: tetratricopeptide repeat protein [bacterium]|nr:tetratricopeptide repeat protein [bacterium]
MIFLFIEIDHPALDREEDALAVDHVRASQYFRIEELLFAQGVHWMKRTPRGMLSLFDKGDPCKAALVLMKEFGSFEWDRFGKARLKMAIHSGEVDEVGQERVGPDMIHAQKVLEAAPPGMILFTVPAVHFVPLPPGARLQDMGVHFLKDLSEPGNLYALLHPDLEGTGLAAPRSLKNHPQNFNPQASPFFGREQAMGEIMTSLRDPAVRLVTLLGPGGFGKTRLALQTAAEMIEDFEDGVFVVHLAPLLSDDLIVGAIASTIKFLFYGAEDPKSQLLNHLKDKQMLLVMDNFEHLIEGTDLVEDILKAAPRVKVMVTSRENLKLEGEKVLDVKGLRYPGDDHGTTFEGSPAVQLFLRSAKRLVPHFKLEPADRPAVTRICALLEGMPLGLELSATWVATLPLDEIASKIETSRDFLATTMPHLPARHRSLRAVFEYSWILLTEPQKKVLRSISVFKGSFSEQAARKIGGATETLLLYLTHKTLLRVLPNGRFEIHELLKYYAKEKLFDDPTEKDRVFAAHAQYFSRFTAKKAEELYGAGQRRALEDLTLEIGNIREAWRRVVALGLEEEMEGFVQGLFHYFEVKGLFREAVESFQGAAEKLEEKFPDPAKAPRKVLALLAWIRSMAAFFQNAVGQGEKARKTFAGCLDLLPPAGFHREAGFCHAGYGVALEWHGDMAGAKRHYEKALASFQKARDRWGMVWNLNNLGHIENRLKRPDKATAHLQKALSYALADKDHRAKAYAHNLMGDLAHDRGRFEEARRNYQHGLTTYLEIGERRGIAWSFTSLGQESLFLGDFAGARQMVLEGLSIFRDLGDTRAVGWCLCLLAQVAWSLGDYLGADRFLEESLQHYREAQDHLGESWVLDWTGNIRLDEGQTAEAEALFRNAFEKAGGEKAVDTSKAWHHYHQGLIHLSQGRRPQARGEMEKALALFTRLEDPTGLDNAGLHLARLYCLEGAPDKGLPILRRVLETALRSGLVPVLAEALTVMARYEKAKGKDTQALAFLLMTLHHPACRQATKDGAKDFYRETEALFPADEVQGALRWAKGSRLEVVVADWLHSHEAVAAHAGRKKTAHRTGKKGTASPKRGKAKKKKGKK